MRDALIAVPAREWMTFDGPTFFAMEGRVYTGGMLTDMRALAESGNARAQFLVGRALDMGLFGATQDRAQAILWYRRAADGGDANAQFMLGYAYFFANGVELNYTEAQRLYSLAAAQGHAVAQVNLGILYRDGLGVARDYSRARTLFTQAANVNYAGAFTGLSTLYGNGLGVPQDMAEAARFLRQGATGGDPFAQGNLGMGLYQGAPGLPQNQTEGLMWLRRAAAAGFQPARDYLTQRNLPLMDAAPSLSAAAAAMRNALAAVPASEWMTFDGPTFFAMEGRVYTGGSLADMRALAESGNARAQFLVARALEVGLFGATQDRAQAILWHRRAADGGDANSQFMLGYAYSTANGVELNYTEAQRLYSLAAAQGHAVAQTNLGIMYKDGLGVARDYSRARTLFTQAANANYAQAFTGLSFLYGNGLGIPQDMAEAARFLRQGATGGDPFAQGNLGMALYQGAPGLPQNQTEGLMWLRRAAAAGFQPARDYLTQRGLPLQ